MPPHSWCRVEYRGPVSAIPAVHAIEWLGMGAGISDPRFLTTSAWKPFVILDALSRLPKDGLLIYGDASTRFTKPASQWLSGDVLEQARRWGFVGRQTFGKVALYTHPKMIEYLSSAHDLVPAGRNLSFYARVPIVCGW